jgi:hypothetical protein
MKLAKAVAIRRFAACQGVGYAGGEGSQEH